MNNRRPYRSNRPGGNRPGGFNRPSRSGGGGGGGGRGGKRGAVDLPILLGEPSPSLAKINEMNMAKLEAKIASLLEEQVHLVARLNNLKALDPQPEDKIKQVSDQLVRLEALKRAAQVRLDGKRKRKAERDAKGL